MSFLTQLNYAQLDSDTVFKLAGCVSSLNEPSLISRLAFNTGFQTKLLRECFEFSPSIMSNVKFMERVRDLLLPQIKVPGLDIDDREDMLRRLSDALADPPPLGWPPS